MTKVISFVIIFFISNITSVHAWAQDSEWATYKGDDVRAANTCITKIVAEMYRKGLEIDALPVPIIVMEDEVKIEEFQAVAAAQMGTYVPQNVLNMYILSTNTIYLVNKYTTPKTGRTAYDVLAHELVHYFQVQVGGHTIEDMTDAAELSATMMQTEFREKYGKYVIDGRFECPL